jgi:hypothetical protein
MWLHAGPAERGGQFTFSDQAIECVLTLKEVFHLPNRGVEGLVRSVFELMQVDLPVPDHCTLSRRGKTVAIHLPKRIRTEARHLVVDSSGFKLYGEGEWKVRQHGWSKRRTWRTFHLTIDSESGDVQAATLAPRCAQRSAGVLSVAGVTDAQMVAPMLAQIEGPIASVAADGSYDKAEVYEAVQAHSPRAEIVIPPRRDAKIQQHGNCQAPPRPRDETLRYIRTPGRAAWKRDSGYHTGTARQCRCRRSLAETAFFRFKTIFDDHLSARSLETQASQLGARCRALNTMSHLGMPASYRLN